MIETFAVATAAILFWKLVGLGLEQFGIWNNRD